MAYENIPSSAGADLTAGPNENIGFVANNFEWFLAGSAAFAALLGGFVAGWFGSLRGWGPGAFSGFISWGVLTVALSLIGAPSLFGIAGAAGSEALGFSVLWAPFASLAAGLVLAVLGGAWGGAASRPGWLFEPQAVDVTEIVERPEGVFVAARRIGMRGDRTRVA